MLTNKIRELYDGVKRHSRKAVKGAAYAALVAAPEVALAQDVTVKGDITVKARVSDDAPAAVRENEERFRLNLLVKGKKWYFAGRHDASFNDSETGYGGLALRRALDKNGRYQLGIGSMNDTRYDAERGEWTTDYNVGINVFAKPLEGLSVMANIPPDMDHAQLTAQYVDALGPLELRAFAKDNLGLPRLQKFELELSGPPMDALGGGQVTFQGNLAGTPAGYKKSFEAGLKWKFGAKGKGSFQGRVGYRHAR